jgi:signal transduction histidine kinase
MNLPPLAVLLLGLVLAGWTLAAAYAVLAARSVRGRALAALANTRRLARMTEENPAQLLLVRTDGRIEGTPRLAQWLGLESLPAYLSELAGEENVPAQNGRARTARGLPEEELAALAEAVLTTQRTSRPFRMTLSPLGTKRKLALRGCLADPQVGPGGSAQVWVMDASDSEMQTERLRSEAERARADFAALVGLIEAAPIPMWFRQGDGALRLVNSAYVRAVGAPDAAAVVAQGTELVERVDGLTPAQVAAQAAQAGQPIERMVSATIDGQRRALKVSDLPLGEVGAGVAGYAIDVEEMEELARSLRAFGEAQRSMLDLLSSGVAQFDGQRKLAFANQTFARLMALRPADMVHATSFERMLDTARAAGRVPEMREYPAWRRERVNWFAANGPVEEAWPLADGTHLRVVAQPLPDGGLQLVVEDRTETLRIAAMRDTLLRTRTATFDNLFEAVAVFAPDGRIQLWNRHFAAAWGLDGDFVDTHPRIAELLERIGARMARPDEAAAVGEAVRAATLERRRTGGRAALADGRTLEYAGVPLPDGNGLLIVLDITDAQKAQGALRERNAALVEADQLKTRFLANMSYEFRTPLTSIGGFAELLQAGLGGELNAPGSEYVEAILTSVARLTDQIETVLDLSQSEAGLLPLARDPVEIFPLVTALVEERRQRILDTGVEFDLTGMPSVGKVEGDARRLSRALGHLIDNALAAAPAGGRGVGRVRVQVERQRGPVGAPRGRKASAPLRITITDNGPGMDAPSLARALGGLAVTGEGTKLERRQGLGLPLARQLIEAHGGTLDLQSEAGRGTTVVVELP